MTRPVSVVFFSGFAIIFLGILAPLIVEMAKPRRVLPSLGTAPSFTLSDSFGKEFDSNQLGGSVWVTNFFFSRCEGPCPAQSAHIAKLARHFTSSKSVQFLSISVDPEHDTTQVLRAYAERFKAEPSQWKFLRGEKDVVVDLLNQGFKLGSLEEPRYHSTRFVLADSKGEIRGYYDGTDPQMVDRLSEDIRQLVRQ